MLAHPQELRSLVMGNRTALFNLLFDAGHYTINTLGADVKWLGAKPGIVSILHTNGQDLSFHPHIHCIVSGGGILPSPGGEGLGVRWVKEKRANGAYLFFPGPLHLLFLTFVAPLTFAAFL